MPLVTRTSVSGNIFKQASEPSDWQNGDLWVDTDDGQLYVNSSGTATAVEGKFQILETYEATSAESSHVFDITAVNFDDDSKLLLVMDGSITAALALQVVINDQTGTDYFVDGRKIDGGTETLIDKNSQTSFELLDSTELSAANRIFAGTVDFYLSKGATSDTPVSNSNFGKVGAPTTDVRTALLNVDSTSISKITVQTSTSTWKIGTRITLYKVKRT